MNKNSWKADKLNLQLFRQLILLGERNALCEGGIYEMGDYCQVIFVNRIFNNSERNVFAHYKNVQRILTIDYFSTVDIQ